MTIRIEPHKYNSPEVLRTIEFIPTDPAKNETQVEDKVIDINFIGTYIRNGLYPPPSLPSGLGTKTVGIMDEVSSDVKYVRADDRVVYAQSASGTYSSIHNINAGKAAILPAAISFEQVAASFLKNLTVYYLLRRACEVEPGEQFLFHAATGDAGSIACQQARALGTRLIDTIGTTQKTQSALKAGARRATDYRGENLVKRLKGITSGKRVHMVYDSVGRDTWERSPDYLQRHGLMVSFGNSSGVVTGVNLGTLSQKDSLYVIRSSLQGYIIMWEGLAEANDELFPLIANGVIKVDVTEQ